MRIKCEAIRFILPALIIFAIVSGSCDGRKSRSERKGLIPENILVDVLTDIYLADGLLTLPRMRYVVSAKDSLETFSDAIGKYGYTLDEMEKTLRYYFVKKPKSLIRIYDLALGRLSEMESRFVSEATQVRLRMEDLWPGEKSYFMPDPFGDDPPGLDLELKEPGTFSLSFSLTIHPDDQTIDPVSGLFLYYPARPDSLQTDHLSTLRYIKDGREHSYSILKTLPRGATVYLRGWFVDYQNQHPGIEKHMSVRNIRFTGTPVR
ncbi:MAG: DUF4296 domain-containing protein [Bacteroidales bacterium]|nr:DUF4296 domain-containing protein [Bacteroidales bacterium]